MYDDMDGNKETNNSQIEEDDESKNARKGDVNIRESLASTNLLDGR